jgi:GT2 family glycosyltransferase
MDVADGQGTSDPPLISVVVPVLNGMPWLEHQLLALSTQQVPVEWEVMVADNGSEDETRACVARWTERDPRIQLVDASAGHGAAAARNVGVRSARGGLVAFCDADDVVRPGWLASVSAALADSDLVAGVFDFGALHGDPNSLPAPAATRQLGFLAFGLSANLAVRREAFEAVHGFAEELSPGEDVDLCWRLQLAGYRFAVAPDAVVEKRERVAGMPTFRAALRALPCRRHAARPSRGGKGVALVGCRSPGARQATTTPSVGAHVRHTFRAAGRFGPSPGVLSLSSAGRCRAGSSVR